MNYIYNDKKFDAIIRDVMNNMSFKEIAMLTNVSINTALGRMRYAILNMRKMAQENHISLSL